MVCLWAESQGSLAGRCSTPTLARIKVRAANNVFATLRVAVKARRDETLDLFEVVEDVSNTAPNSVPTATNVYNKLEAIFGKQANVHFAVNRIESAGACSGRGRL
jgi:hypothetical protein